jgi:hypothetical protein
MSWTYSVKWHYKTKCKDFLPEAKGTLSWLCGSRPSYTQHIYWYYCITLILVYHSASTCFELSGSSSGTY